MTMFSVGKLVKIIGGVGKSEAVLKLSSKTLPILVLYIYGLLICLISFEIYNKQCKVGYSYFVVLQKRFGCEKRTPINTYSEKIHCSYGFCKNRNTQTHMT